MALFKKSSAFWTRLANPFLRRNRQPLFLSLEEETSVQHWNGQKFRYYYKYHTWARPNFSGGGKIFKSQVGVLKSRKKLHKNRKIALRAIFLSGEGVILKISGGGIPPPYPPGCPRMKGPFFHNLCRTYVHPVHCHIITRAITHISGCTNS